MADERNLIALCRRHHHRITHGWDRDLLAPVLAEQLPDLITFAADYRIKGALDHELRLYGLPVVP